MGTFMVNGNGRHLRAGLLLSAVLWLSGCATQQPVSYEIPPLHVNEPAVQVVDVDVLAVSPEMDVFLEQYILPYSNIHTRMTLLMDAVSANGMLDFDYDDSYTLTSVDAFNKHAGNCIGFANMLIALARRSGIKARYQEVLKRHEWSTREETVLLVKHINVILEGAGYTYVMDVSGIRLSPTARRQLISDSYAKALYYNNLGAEALIKNDLPTAYAFMTRAIETEPELTDSWINIGVVLGRNGQLADAETVLRKALEINNSEYTALSNLYEIYITQEKFEAAAAIENRVERYRQRNPYYLMQLSEETLLQGDTEEALKLIQRAVKKKDNDHQLYFALAWTQYMAGQVEAAQTSLDRARELAPAKLDKHYQRPLEELVAEARLESQSG